MTDDVDVAVEEWDPRTIMLGVEEEGVAVPLDGAISYASSLLSALLFACVILALLRIAAVFSRYIGDAVRTHMVRNKFLDVKRCTCAHFYSLSLSITSRSLTNLPNLFARSYFVAHTLT